MLASKHFSKQIGALEAIIMDAAHEEKSQEVKPFLNNVGTMLRLFEEGTTWFDRA